MAKKNKPLTKKEKLEALAPLRDCIKEIGGRKRLMELVNKILEKDKLKKKGKK